MEVSIRVTRTMPDGSQAVFEAVAHSIEGAIAAADQLANGKAEPKTGAGTADTKPAPAEEKKAPPKKETVAKDPAPANTAKAETKETAAPGVSYEEVRKAITGLAGAKGREITMAMLARFGVTSGKDLKPEQYDEVHATAARVLSGEYNPLASEQNSEEMA